jgi:hypothetical protein
MSDTLGDRIKSIMADLDTAFWFRIGDGIGDGNRPIKMIHYNTENPNTTYFVEYYPNEESIFRKNDPMHNGISRMVNRPKAYIWSDRVVGLWSIDGDNLNNFLVKLEDKAGVSILV